MAKVVIRYPSFVPGVKILKYFGNRLYLVLNPQVIKTLLEFTVADRVVIVFVEVPVGIANVFESFLQLNPEEV